MSPPSIVNHVTRAPTKITKMAVKPPSQMQDLKCAESVLIAWSLISLEQRVWMIAR